MYRSGVVRTQAIYVLVLWNCSKQKKADVYDELGYP